MGRRHRTLGAALCAVAVALTAVRASRAGESERTLWNVRPRSLLGLPTGFVPTATQRSAVWSNVAGGARRDIVYTGLLTLGARLDLDAAGWVPGGSMGLVGLGVQGANVSPVAVGDASIVSNIAGVQTVRLFKWWYEQCWHDGAVRLRAGQIPLDDDFMVIESALLFLQSGFGTPQTEALNTPAPIYPLGALGTRLAVAPGGGWELLLGAYDGDAGAEEDEPHLADLELNADQAAIALAEVAWEPPGLGGALRASVGGFAHFGVFPDLRTGEEERGLGSVYAAVEGGLGRWRGSEVTTFGRVAVALPAARVMTTSYGDVGIVAGGGAWRRPDDRIGLGVAWTVFGAAHVADRRAAGEPVTVRETVVELTYAAAALPWLHFQPSLQWLLGPHFSRRDALVIGARATAEL